MVIARNICSWFQRQSLALSCDTPDMWYF